MDDAQYMTEAFDLAEKGRGSTHPNPLVGAVLVREGEVVGRGWHLAAGEPHAEAMALTQAAEAARGATLYCTLEPCSHHGKTPPCADAIVAAGVSRAVVALGDPNPQVDGGGFRKLREGGVVVEVAEGQWGARARTQNAPFLKFHRDGLPLVTYKAAVTLDGKVAAEGGDARWISCLDSRRAVHELRARADAVMVGAGTVRRDDPELTVRLADGRDPVRVVITHDGDLPPAAKLLASAGRTRTIVVAQLAQAASVHLRVRVAEGDHRAGDAGRDQCVGARRRLAVVTARLERAEERRPTSALARLGQRVRLGVRLSRRQMPAAPDGLSVAYQDGAYQWIGVRTAAAALGQSERLVHIQFVVHTTTPRSRCSRAADGAEAPNLLLSSGL
jgi:diaminohydroxyphosphoribosylaminopyrimidine deaminase/5-amino-6-(5-phosphoribosylamino)uracil reductase